MHIFIKPGHSHDLREAAFNIPKGIQKLLSFPKYCKHMPTPNKNPVYAIASITVLGFSF